MATKSRSQKSNGQPTLTTQLDLCLKVIQSFRVAKQSESPGIEQVEILLAIEGARLYCWGLALGIIDVPVQPGVIAQKPSIVRELTSSYRQKSISGALLTLHGLLTDTDLIRKAYGCLPFVPSEGVRPEVYAKETLFSRGAGARFALVFDSFSSSTAEPTNAQDYKWIINDDGAFRFFVAEIRTLVSQLHGITDTILPAPARNAMIYSRLREITSGWVALAIAVACDEIYHDLWRHAIELADVLDMEDEQVGQNVRDFIDRLNSGNGLRSSMHHVEHDYALRDYAILHQRRRQSVAEKRLLALESCVFGDAPSMPEHTGPPDHGKVTDPAEPVGGSVTSMPPLQPIPPTNTDGHRRSPRRPYGPPPARSADKILPKVEPVGPGSAPIVRVPPPTAVPFDEPVVAKDSKPTTKTQTPSPERIYTPRTSSVDHRGGGPRRAEVWDDLSSDSDLSDDDISDDDLASRLARTETTPSHKAVKYSTAPRAVPECMPVDTKENRAAEDYEQQLAMPHGATAVVPQPGRVRAGDKPWWNGHEVQKVPEPKMKKWRHGVEDDFWKVEARAGRHTMSKDDHHHCGSCGEPMDESGQRL